MEFRQSPPVQRVTSILNFFLEHPTQPFTLAQVAKSLKLSRATAHSILLSMVAAGYLYRRHDKSYVLGLALPTMAAKALQQISPLAIASQEMRTLADELDVVVTALFKEGDNLVIRERAASVNHLGILASRTIGAVHPARPGGHHLFQLPLSDSDYVAFLDKNVPAMTEDMNKRFLSNRDFVRQHGFAARLKGRDGEMGEAIPFDYLDHISPEMTYDVHHVVAPVINYARQVEFIISLFGFAHPLKGTELLAAGKLLDESCQRISQFIGGTARSAA